MQTYTRKAATVEARQHEGLKLTVISALKGEQVALSGDYLITDPAASEPRGSIYVISKAEFERDFEAIAEPVIETEPEDPATGDHTETHE